MTIGPGTPERRQRDDGHMLRNAIIHISNEQPLLADLFEMPTSADASLVCTNIRMLDGKKPIFIEHSTSVFVFPYLHIRFVEIMPGSSSETPEPAPDEIGSVAVAPAAELDPEPEVDLELDEDFLRRIRDV
ncbi:MAG: hypothetical protein QOF49_328 [Chloroflexota bacterium]|jgi:hypothetical protein|nr:hypothetical protein [Chloroflexota bacterium]